MLSEGVENPTRLYPVTIQRLSFQLTADMNPFEEYKQQKPASFENLWAFVVNLYECRFGLSTNKPMYRHDLAVLPYRIRPRVRGHHVDT